MIDIENHILGYIMSPCAGIHDADGGKGSASLGLWPVSMPMPSRASPMPMPIQPRKKRVVPPPLVIEVKESAEEARVVVTILLAVRIR